MSTESEKARHARDMVGHLLAATAQSQLQLRRIYSLLELGDHEDDMAVIIEALEPLAVRLSDDWAELLFGDTQAALDTQASREERQRRASQSARTAFASWVRFWEQEHANMLRLKHESGLLARMELFG